MSAELIEGYVWLSSYDDRNNRNQEHSTEYKRVFDAMKEGQVHGLQDGKSKRWIVNKAQADALLAERAESKRIATKSQSRRQASLQFRVNGAPAEQYEAAVVALCEINNGITLMQVTLERLTTAVESIATQPKTPHQESMATIGGNGSWRDMNGEAH